MPVFDHDDAAYVDWLDANPDGFVLNSYRRPQSNYLILHRATCKFISRTAKTPIAWTTGAYIKVCSASLPNLAAWCRVVVDGQPQPCKQCHPETIP